MAHDDSVARDSGGATGDVKDSSCLEAGMCTGVGGDAGLGNNPTFFFRHDTQRVGLLQLMSKRCIDDLNAQMCLEIICSSPLNGHLTAALSISINFGRRGFLSIMIQTQFKLHANLIRLFETWPVGVIGFLLDVSSKIQCVFLYICSCFLPVIFRRVVLTTYVPGFKVQNYYKLTRLFRLLKLIQIYFLLGGRREGKLNHSGSVSGMPINCCAL